MRWSLIAAVNNEHVLERTLLRSPEIGTASEILLKRGFPSASQAYNAGLSESSGDVLVFAHQDVYLPAGWVESLAIQLECLERADDHWAVVGVFGVDANGRRVGHAYSTGLQAVLGQAFDKPRRVRAVDEMLIVLRRRAGLMFDPQLPGYHLYGADICLEAARRGCSSYVISNYCVHNSNGLGDNLPVAFWQAYRYLQRKWRAELPVETPCITITNHPFTMAGHWARGMYYRLMGQERIGRRVDDPERFAIAPRGKSATPA